MYRGHINPSILVIIYVDHLHVMYCYKCVKTNGNLEGV